MSHLVSHLDGAPTSGGALPGMGASDSSAPSSPAIIPAPMPSPQQALTKSVLVVGVVALLAYGACCALRSKK